MFREQAAAIAPKKDDVVVNMVLAINLKLDTQKCGIQGIKTSQEQEFGQLARRGKTSTFF
jgi:hypothetical protein